MDATATVIEIHDTAKHIRAARIPSLMEILQAEWKMIKRAPRSEREKYLDSQQAIIVLGAATIAKIKRRLRRERRCLGHLSCSAPLTHDVWNEGRRYYPAWACRCDACLKMRRWPRYYSPSGLSYECFLERKWALPDEELGELLEPLRGISASIVDIYDLKKERRKRR